VNKINLKLFFSEISLKRTKNYFFGYRKYLNNKKKIQKLRKEKEKKIKDSDFIDTGNIFIENHFGNRYLIDETRELKRGG
jgi:hypothetical protein